MDAAKWDKYLNSTHNDPSGTSSEEARIYETKKAIDLAVEVCKPTRGSVLILGCGDGIEVEHFRSLGFQKIIGTTYPPDELRQPEMVYADMHDLPFADKEFDFVYSKETLEHSIAPYIALCEINRVLKLDGKYAILISEGIEKQRYPYHFSAFPQWVWFDLFYKAALVNPKYGFEHVYSKADQSGYFGVKLEDKNFDRAPETEALDAFMNAHKKQGDLNVIMPPQK